jgi:hypothetical protein
MELHAIWFELDFLNWMETKFLNLPIWELFGRSVVGYLSFCWWHGTSMNYMFMLVKLQNQIDSLSSIWFCNLTSMILKTKLQFLLFSTSSNFTVGFDLNQWKRTIFFPTQMHSKFPQCIQIAVVKWLNFECKNTIMGRQYHKLWGFNTINGKAISTERNLKNMAILSIDK